MADLLTFSQLKELAATPSQLNGTQDVTKVMTVIEPADFAAFFDSLAQAVAVNKADLLTFCSVMKVLLVKSCRDFLPYC